MTFVPSAGSLAELLPGSWHIGATNFPMWLRGDRLNPTLSYEVRSEQPLKFLDTVTYSTRAGVRKSIVGVDTLRGDGLVWRGRGILLPFRSHWKVEGTGPSDEFVVTRFSKSLVTPAGVDIMVRHGARLDSQELRTIVATSAGEFGLTPEDLATLTWLELPASA
ncbi:hypothetical protein [Lacisediminihabitans changchengi]|uniref:Uncharacterized protein n=1 Tax=Lacisediminihabitans changchengi TaxID=2787634 RepID=A0A934SKF9_9MICO|nr:hypothetical protein [Lacisediminihabitans changchengi]MBK4346557.1 hypothetical protein [Lacisediminihabitans changchengi]